MTSVLPAFSADRARRPLPHRGRAWLLGVVLPVLSVVLVWAIVASRLRDLPDRVVTHWGPDGPDAWGAPGDLLIPLAVITAICLLITCPVAVLTGRQAATRALAIGISAGLGTTLAGLTLAIVQAAVAVPPGDPVIGMGLAVGAGLAVGVAAGAAAGADPVVPAREPVLADAPRAPLSPTERAVWTAHIGMPRAAAAVVVVLVVAGIVLLWWLAGVTTALVWSAVLLLPLLVVGLSAFRVRVDREGLTVRSDLGPRVLHARADEVVRADVTEVSPMRDFGGWGLRTDTRGRIAVVVRSGPAIQVERTGGRLMVVTVPDAERGAALLNTMAERARGVRHDPPGRARLVDDSRIVPPALPSVPSIGAGRRRRAAHDPPASHTEDPT